MKRARRTIVRLRLTAAWMAQAADPADFMSRSIEDIENIQCPFCGSEMELALDVSVNHQRFVTDCENCCRPFEVVAEFEDGAVVSLDVRT